MKKSLIVLTALLLAFLSSKAQTEKGNQNLGLTTAFSILQSSNLNINQNDFSTSTDSYKSTTFTFGPHYSYFIADNLDIGINLSYQSSVANYNNNDPNVEGPQKLSSKQYSSDVFVQKYFMHKNRIGLRVGAYVGYGYDSQATTYDSPYQSNNNSNKSNYGWAGLNADLVYYPSKHLGLAANIFNLQFEHYIENNAPQGNGNGNDVNLSFISDGLSLSVFYVFGGKG
jgi:hypothetical protein